MKYLYFLLFLLTSVNAHAEGSLTLSLPFYDSVHIYGPDAGLYVRESLGGRFYYDSWTGGRVNQYFSTNQDVYYKLGKTTDIGIGPSFSSGNLFLSGSYNEIRGSVLLRQKLW